MLTHRMRSVAIAGAVVALDQATKWAACRYLPSEGTRFPVLPHLLELCRIHNTGAAWGVLQGRSVFLICFSIAAVAFLVWRRRALLGYLPLGWLVMGLLVGGICGNLIDRVFRKYVLDYLYFHWGAHYFPAFNVADAAICVGVGLFLLLQWRHERRQARAAHS